MSSSEETGIWNFLCLCFRQLILTLFFILLSPIDKLYTWVVMGNIVGQRNNESKHIRKVRRVQEQVLKWQRGNKNKKMCTNRPGWRSVSFSKVDKSEYHQIDISFLKDVVNIDTEKRLLTVEPEMMNGRLTKILEAKGWTMPVVVEIDTLSIGGLIAGVAGLQTSSHNHALICDTALEYEVVLPDGSVVTCNKDENPDLFYTIPGSYCTAGFITSVTFPIIPATKCLKLEYTFVDSIESAKDLMNLRKPNHEFVEGFAYSKDEFVLIFGDMTTDPEKNSSLPVNFINSWYKPFYHLHAKQVMDKLKSGISKTATYTEYVPLRDYYHRHTRGLYWLIPNALPLFKNGLVMFLLGWLFPISCHLQNYLVRGRWTRSLLFRNDIIQDYAIPMDNLPEIFHLGHKMINVFPIWLCPIKLKRTQGMCQIPETSNGEYIDIGFYGKPPPSSKFGMETLKHFEKYCIQCNGFLGLYAETYMSKKEFRQMFDPTLYDRVRKELKLAFGFPYVYDKICSQARRLDIKSV